MSFSSVLTRQDIPYSDDEIDIEIQPACMYFFTALYLYLFSAFSQTLKGYYILPQGMTLNPSVHILHRSITKKSIHLLVLQQVSFFSHVINRCLCCIHLSTETTRHNIRSLLRTLRNDQVTIGALSKCLDGSSASSETTSERQPGYDLVPVTQRRQCITTISFLSDPHAGIYIYIYL